MKELTDYAVFEDNWEKSESSYVRKNVFYLEIFF